MIHVDDGPLAERYYNSVVNGIRPLTQLFIALTARGLRHARCVHYDCVHDFR